MSVECRTKMTFWADKSAQKGKREIEVTATISSREASGEAHLAWSVPWHWPSAEPTSAASTATVRSSFISSLVCRTLGAPAHIPSGGVSAAGSRRDACTRSVLARTRDRLLRRKVGALHSGHVARTISETCALSLESRADPEVTDPTVRKSCLFRREIGIHFGLSASSRKEKQFINNNKVNSASVSADGPLQHVRLELRQRQDLISSIFSIFAHN